MHHEQARLRSKLPITRLGESLTPGLGTVPIGWPRCDHAHRGTRPERARTPAGRQSGGAGGRQAGKRGWRCKPRVWGELSGMHPNRSGPEVAGSSRSSPGTGDAPLRGCVCELRGAKGPLGLQRLVRARGADGKGDKMERCCVMEGRKRLRWHPSILAYTSKGHTYSMTGLPCCSPSCPAPPGQLSRRLRALQPPPAMGVGAGGEAGGTSQLAGAPPM